MVEFDYAINQPDDSRIMVDSKNLLKTKTTDYIPVRPAAFDFSKTKLPVSKYTLEAVIKDFHIIKQGESALVVKTVGDLFQFDRKGIGYTGDWKINVAVTKIIIIHFFEGTKGNKAHVYIADYVTRQPQTQYTQIRVRFFFKNILSGGTINVDILRDFDSFQLITY